MPVIIFDLDDTLVNDTGATRKSVKQTLESARLPAHQAAVDQAILHIRKMWARHPHRRTGALASVSGWEALWLPTHDSGLPAEVDASLRAHEIRVWATIIASLGGTPGKAAEAAAMYRYHRHQGLRLLPGVEAGLETLGRRHALWVATNGLPAQQRMKIAATGLETSIERILISGEIGAPKADATFAAAIQRWLHQDQQRVCMVIGDSTDQDLALAGNGGWPAVHICPADRCPVVGPQGIRVTHAPSLSQVNAPCC